ncbi:hypothetical protein D3C81_822430 [compost metagenome]
MRHRCCQFDMPHPFAAHFSASNLNAAAVADDAFVANAFIFTAMTFPVFGWAKNLFAEQPFLLWFQRTVVDRFRFLHFSAGPRTNFIWGSKPNFHKLEVVDVQQGASLLNQVLILTISGYHPQGGKPPEMSILLRLPRLPGSGSVYLLTHLPHRQFPSSRSLLRFQ